MRLREWKIMNAGQSVNQSTTKTITAASSTSNNSTSNNSDYKNRFKKLLDYVKAHSKAERKEIKKLTNNRFHYLEHHNEKDYEWDMEILVITLSNYWAFHYYVDGHYEHGEKGEGYEDLIRALSFYINTPSVGTAEYADLLTEWVAVKNSAADSLELYETLWN